MRLEGGCLADFLEEANLLGVIYSKLKRFKQQVDLSAHECAGSWGLATASSLRLCCLSPAFLGEGLSTPCW